MQRAGSRAGIRSLLLRGLSPHSMNLVPTSDLWARARWRPVIARDRFANILQEERARLFRSDPRSPEPDITVPDQHLTARPYPEDRSDRADRAGPLRLEIVSYVHLKTPEGCSPRTTAGIGPASRRSALAAPLARPTAGWADYLLLAGLVVQKPWHRQNRVSAEAVDLD